MSCCHPPKPCSKHLLNELTGLSFLLFLEDCSEASFLQHFKLSYNWQLKCVCTLYINSSSSLVSPSGCIYRQCSHPCPAFIFLCATNQALFVSEDEAYGGWPWLAASPVCCSADLLFRRILSKWSVWKKENNDAWEFFHSDESLNIRETGKFQNKPKLAVKFYFVKFQMEIQAWFGFMGVIFGSVGQEWPH